MPTLLRSRCRTWDNPRKLPRPTIKLTHPLTRRHNLRLRQCLVTPHRFLTVPLLAPAQPKLPPSRKAPLTNGRHNPPPLPLSRHRPSHGLRRALPLSSRMPRGTLSTFPMSRLLPLHRPASSSPRRRQSSHPPQLRHPSRPLPRMLGLRAL